MTTAIFTVMDRALLRALPYPHPNSWRRSSRMSIARAHEETEQTGATWERLHRGVPSLVFAAITGRLSAVNVVGGDRPTVVNPRSRTRRFLPRRAADHRSRVHGCSRIGRTVPPPRPARREPRDDGVVLPTVFAYVRASRLGARNPSLKAVERFATGGRLVVADVVARSQRRVQDEVRP